MSALASLHFLRPWWLLMVLPPLIVATLRLFGTRKSEQWNRVIAPHLLEHLLTKAGRSPWLSPEVLLLPFALITAVAMAGPAYRLANTPNTPDDTTLLIVVDLSSSMAGRDIGPSRIGRLRLKLHDLIRVRRGSRIGLIAVAGSAHVVMPPTDDGDALAPYIDVLDPKLMPSDGERFEDAAPLLEQLARSSPGATVAVIAADSIPPFGAKALAALGNKSMSLVGWEVGTEAGAPGSGVPGLDHAGFSVLERAGAEIVELGLGSSDIRQISDLLDRARKQSLDPKDASLWEDSGYALVFVAALGVLFWFRRGWVIGRLTFLLLTLLLGTGCSGKPADSPWLNLWLTPNQQGRRLFEQGKYKEAALAFQDPMWKGVSYYTAHDWGGAKEQFSRIDTAEGLFNLANAHAQAQEIASAISVYNQALERKPTFLAARKNRDYFEEVLAGLEQTTDFDTLKKPDDTQADPTKAQLRPDQKQGPKDLAAEMSAKREEKRSLSAAETDQWMKRVTTNPADFLRAKFATQDARKSP